MENELLKDCLIGALVGLGLLLLQGWLDARAEVHELREVARLSCQVHPRHLVVGQLEADGQPARAVCDYLDLRDRKLINVRATRALTC